MPDELAVVFDCGSTNATVVAVDGRGQIAKSAGHPNAPVPTPGGEGWRIWDLEQVWGKLADACQQVCAAVDSKRVKAVTVAAFGADGAPVRADGTLTYPVICWQDDRTEQLAREIIGHVTAQDIFDLTGYQVISFNTLLRLMWLRQNAPQALDEAHCWLMMPGLLSMTLSGQPSIDPTSAGTTMAMDMGQRDWSGRMLALADLDESFFPAWVEPGQVIGQVTSRAAQQTGLPAGIPVVAAGHDTQFAAIGSGAQPYEAILSSGTWEILMLRVDQFQPSQFAFEEGVLFECDALAGWWDPQLLMMGGAVLEWIREHFFSAASDRRRTHEEMIAASADIHPGSDGVRMIPSFVPDTGPTKKLKTRGTIFGLNLQTSGPHVYRAALEGLSFQLRSALEILQETVGFQARGLRVVGGGSRNELWNQIRADVTGLPVTTIAQREATVRGAALFAFVGAGVFSSLEEAVSQMHTDEITFEPSAASHTYTALYERYCLAPLALREFYS